MSAQAQQVRSHPIVQQAQAKVNYYVAQLDKELSRYPLAHQFEQKTNVPKAYGAIGTVTLLSLLIFINALAAPISNLVGWLLPAYLSVKAIESPGHDDDVQWLTYWVTFGFFNFLESFALGLVLHYLPFYFVFKTIFIIWLQLPQTKGARTLYHSVYRPLSSNYTKGSPATGPVSSDGVDATAADLRSKVNTATL